MIRIFQGGYAWLLVARGFQVTWKIKINHKIQDLTSGSRVCRKLPRDWLVLCAMGLLEAGVFKISSFFLFCLRCHKDFNDFNYPEEEVEPLADGSVRVHTRGLRTTRSGHNDARIWSTVRGSLMAVSNIVIKMKSDWTRDQRSILPLQIRLLHPRIGLHRTLCFVHFLLPQFACSKFWYYLDWKKCLSRSHELKKSTVDVITRC